MNARGLKSDGWELIVVGAGSAGAALAARCAERGTRVLLLEAGPDFRSADLPEVWRSPNPAKAKLDLDRAGDVIWKELFATRTDAQAPSPYWRGRGVGGSSTINGEIAIRPPLEDYDSWVAAGCIGWGPDEVLPFFSRLETDEQFGAESYHGSTGPIPVYRMPRDEWGGVDTAFAEAGLAHGFPWADDINAPGAHGVSPYPINSRGGLRVTTNDAYLEPLRGNDALTVVGYALVDRVLFEGTRAVGVRALIGGESVELRGEQVVLAAGAIHSPTILYRSGIGSASRLRDLGSDCLVDLPVGEGLQDHPMIMMSLALTPEASTRTTDDRHTNAAIRYTSSLPGAPVGDMFMVSLNQATLAMETADLSAGAGAIGVWLNRPYSTGDVLVGSLDPEAHPFIRENMLADPRDRARLREGVQHLVEMCRDPAVASRCRLPIEEANRDLFEALADGGDAALDAFMLRNASDTQHATSTCRMGDPGSPTTVVDPDCRVLGVDGLRVVDASIFPYTSRSNTHLACVMVGEFMSDRIAPPA